MTEWSYAAQYFSAALLRGCNIQNYALYTCRCRGGDFSHTPAAFRPPAAGCKRAYQTRIHIYIYCVCIYVRMYIFNCLRSPIARCFIRGDIDPPHVYTDMYQLPLGDGGLAKASERTIHPPGRQSIARMRFIWRPVVSLRSRYCRSGTRQVTYSPQQARIRESKMQLDSNQVWSSVWLVAIFFFASVQSFYQCTQRYEECGGDSSSSNLELLLILKRFFFRPQIRC